MDGRINLRKRSCLDTKKASKTPSVDSTTDLVCLYTCSLFFPKFNPKMRLYHLVIKVGKTELVQKYYKLFMLSS